MLSACSASARNVPSGVVPPTLVTANHSAPITATPITATPFAAITSLAQHSITAAAAATAIPSLTPAPVFLNPRLTVLAENLPNPDDLLMLPDGSFYLSDVGDGTIRQFETNGKVHVVLSGLKEPEGMVLLPDGMLAFIEQGLNRLDRWDRKSQQAQPWLTLENNTHLDGVDNIALDARPGSPTSLIIPDSPNNRMLRLSLDGKTITEITSGLVRPTGAWVEPDGSLLVVQENGNKLDRIHPDGQIERLGLFSIPDDVVEDAAGNIFVCTLGDGAVYWLAPGSKQPQHLVSGLSSPQGMALDTQGNLLVTDPGHHRLVKLILH